MTFRILIICLILVASVKLQAQSAYWVFFKDKPADTTMSFEDIPVNQEYVENLKIEGYRIKGVSKWLNAACVFLDGKSLPSNSYIRKVQKLGHYKASKNSESFDTSTYGHSDVQLKMLGLDWMHHQGYTGKGIKLALFDAGYYGIDTLSCFQKIWDENRIGGHYDFVLDRPLAFDQSSHGAYVLSIAGGRCDDSLVGAAPEATFYLARTEEAEKETHLEEYYWAYALEWAYERGVDIIHSSLGYSRFDTLQGDYTYEDMDGETTIITQATQMAIAKGIFVTNSAGNEGDKEWKYITAPCDGKNVLCVGAVDSFENYAEFSSVGPSYDGRVKPEVTAMGKKTSYQDKFGPIKQGNGTSFSGPLIAGFVACLMEANPEAYNSQIFEAIIKSADRYLNPDNFYGYGIPNAFRADSILKEMVLATKSLDEASFTLYPNPSNRLIQVHSPVPVLKISIMNAIGQLIQTLDLDYASNEIDVSLMDLAQGVYFIQVKDLDGKVGVRRFVKSSY